MKYTGAALTTVPLFINGTGSEWFAVVNDTSKSAITDYATSMAPGFNFTNSYGNVVPFNNIVTTLMTDMNGVFQNASTFNQPIGAWDTSNVTTMANMFNYAGAFNGDISSWNTTNVTTMFAMFQSTATFNGNITTWNTAKVANMNQMFVSAVFNGNISSWNTANVTTMDYMFYNATVFNQNISGWNVTNVTSHADFSSGSALSPANSPVWT